MKTAKAFTLIEMVVVIGVLGLVMSAVMGIMVNVFRAKNRIEVTDNSEQIGGQLLNQLKEDVVTASGVGMTCVTDGSSEANNLVYSSAVDGGVTTLSCVEGTGIASASANGTYDLTGSEVTVSGCNDFARCVPYPGSSDRIESVNFSFTLSAGVSGSGAQTANSRKFQSTVVVRN